MAGDPLGLNLIPGAGLSKFQEKHRRASALDVRIDPVRRSSWTPHETCAFFRCVPGYFPMQKLLKMTPSSSSAENAPVISPSAS
ncbi:hypothetical protein ABIC83_003806 [Roseateles asaccharophilus]|uniref:Uncharacterized protein n=1 Tax=Roseateles asaccharophilus TaxID=582607 RepID=A0ABU2ABS0_9BURK|nr:hypothetical protein [Roseateles asaccharophilus]